MPLKKLFNKEETLNPQLLEVQADPGLREAESALISLESGAKRRIFQNALFVASLLLTLMSGSYLWLARIGWTLLAILFVIDLRYSLFSAFFFAAWFQGAGFLPNLGFTLKHFHLAVFLSMVVSAFKGSFIQAFLSGLERGRYLLFILAILMMGLINSAIFATGIEGLRTPANISVIVVALFYLLGLIEQFGRDDLSEVLETSMIYFLSGVSITIGLAIFNRLTELYYLNVHLIHNNHMGILSSFSLFYALSFLIIAPSWKKRALYLGFATLIFAALIASCSRTSWLAFVAGFVFYMGMLLRFKKISWIRCVFGFALPLLGVFVAVIFGVSQLSKATYERLIGLPQLLDGAYWKYTLFDRENFGFLGRFRLQQFFDLNDIFQNHFLTGVGFRRQVVDFHGLYFCLMGATGLVGLGFFAFFCRYMIRRLVDRVKTSSPRALLSAGCLTAFVIWLMVSFLESYFVQFSAWLNVLVVLTLISSEDLRARAK